MTAADAQAIVERYFACMRAGDIAVVELFHADATLRGLGFRKHGQAEIREFYAGVIAGARPSPSPAGPLLVDGGRVIAEINIALANGESVHVLDVFQVEAGRIRSLTYFTADYPTD